ncbi:MAG TPA: hypothetical protein VL118_08890, partial [Luteimonas sp.]|nr:hypothetical protein [Luteimonas sp.]
CTSGKSLEAARAYLLAAGAHVKLFSWLKTVNTAYTEIFPQISVIPYSKNTMPTEPTHRSWSYSHGIADSAASVELAQVFALYNSWDWSKY